MKQKGILPSLIVLFLLPMFACARPGMSEFQSIQSEIQERIETGDYPGALEKFVELRDLDIKYNIAPHVRNSFVLGDWVELASLYKPASEALWDIQQDLFSKILGGKADAMAFSELQAINRSLGEQQNTIDALLMLEKNFPRAAKRAYIFWESTVIEQKRFDIVKRYTKDLIYKYEGVRYSRERELSHRRTEPDKTMHRDPKRIDERFVAEVLKLITVSQAINETDTALEIQRRAMDYFPDERIAQAISAG